MDSREGEVVRYFKSFRDKSDGFDFEMSGFIGHQFAWNSKGGTPVDDYCRGVSGRVVGGWKEPFLIVMVITHHQNVLCAVRCFPRVYVVELN